MRYRLDELAALAAELGFEARRVDHERLDVVIDDAVLAFCNLSKDADSLVGFDGTPWHSHDHVQFLTGSSSWVECDELEILTGLRSGELVVISQLVGGVIRDRWLAHRDEPLDLRHVEPGEELRVRRLPDRTTRVG
jgi:hypothetical protein